MANTPFTATKHYKSSPFVLTDRKLSRVIEVAKERFERINGVNKEHKPHERYEVDFSNGKELRINSLENLLSLDNSKKNPVAEIRINLEIESEKEDEPMHGLWIHFISKGTRGSTILLSGISIDLAWLQETMGALEEQLERTIPTDWAYKLNGSAAPVFFVALLSFFLIPFSYLEGKQMRFGLPESRIEELASLSKGGATKTDSEKLDFVFRYFSATLENDSAAEKITRLTKNPRTYLIGVPALVGLLSAIVAIFFFYPRHVFAWGDCGEDYERTVERRKFLWYGVFLALVIGVLGNLFVVGITG